MFEQRVNSDVLTVSTVNSQDQVTQKPLRDSVKQALKNYFAQLNGQDVNRPGLVMKLRPLFTVMPLPNLKSYLLKASI